MAYYSGINRSTTRLTGLSSGLDTDALVEAAMSNSQAKLNRLQQKKTTYEWKLSAYNDVRSKVQTFSNKYLSQLSEDNVFSRSALNKYKVNMSSDKYSSYFSVKGTSNAQAGSHKISSTKLAKSATIETKAERNRYAGYSSSSTANSHKTVTGTRELYMKNDDGTFSKITADKAASVDLKNVYYKDVGGKDQGKDETGATASFSRAFKGGDAISMSVNGGGSNTSSGVSVAVDTGSLGDVIKQANDNGVTMSFDNGKVTLTSKTVGDKSSLTFGGRDTAGPDGNMALFGSDGLFGIDAGKVKDEVVLEGDTKLSQIKDLTGRDVLGTGDKIKFSIKTSATGETKEFTFDKDATIDDIITTVNGTEKGFGAEVLTFDEASGQFMVRSNVNGTDSQMEIKNLNGNFFGNGTNNAGLTGIAEGKTTGYQTIDRTTDTIASAAAKMGVALNGDKLSFKINGKEFSFDKNTKLSDMMSKINGDETLGARITYSQITDKFEITSTATGDTSKVTFENGSSGDAASFFGVLNGGTQGNAVSANGSDAEIVIDGQTIKRSSNNFTLDGLDITIYDDFQAEMYDKDGNPVKDKDGNVLTPTVKGLGTASLTVEQDVDSVVDKMKNFVTAYNELVDSLYQMTTEQKDYDYEPLTEAERSAMEDKDIEKYETEAKKGILHGDSAIRSLLSTMRSAIFEKLGGEGLAASDLGFDTSKYATGEYGGKIQFDETKFRNALKKDPEAVANALASVEDDSGASDGFLAKIQNTMYNFTSKLRSREITNTTKNITDLDKSIDDQIDKMYEEQERLYQQYAALETLMSQYQAQSTWMTQQFSSLTTTG